MSQIRLNLRELNPLEKVAFAQRVAAGIDGNPDVPNPKVTPAQLKTAADTLQQRENKVREAETVVTVRAGERDTTEDELDDLLRVLAGDVEEKTEGDPAKISATNFLLREDNGPVGPLPAPSALQITIGDMEGELDAQWNPVQGRQFYEVQVKEEGAADWVTKVTETKSRVTITSLVSGKRYRVRVRAKGAAGFSPWSDEAGPKTAP